MRRQRRVGTAVVVASAATGPWLLAASQSLGQGRGSEVTQDPLLPLLEAVRSEQLLESGPFGCLPGMNRPGPFYRRWGETLSCPCMRSRIPATMLSMIGRSIMRPWRSWTNC